MSNGGNHKSHIFRIYQDGDTSSDTWIDIERLDEMSVSQRGGFEYLLSHWTFDWDRFDPTQAPKKYISNPDDDGDVIEVPIRNTVFVIESTLGYRHYFVNDDSNKSRETVTRRVYHYDVPDDFLDDDLQPPRHPDAYLACRGDKDPSQHVDTELLDQYWTNQATEHTKVKVFRWQKKKWGLLADDTLVTVEEIDPADGSPPPVTMANGGDAVEVIIDPPWRLDPLQNIVNINWGGLAVIFGPQFEDAPKQEKTK